MFNKGRTHQTSIQRNLCRSRNEHCIFVRKSRQEYIINVDLVNLIVNVVSHPSIAIREQVTRYISKTNAFGEIIRDYITHIKLQSHKSTIARTFRAGWRPHCTTHGGIVSRRQINAELAKRASKRLGTTGNKVSPRRHFYLPMLLHGRPFHARLHFNFHPYLRGYYVPAKTRFCGDRIHSARRTVVILWKNRKFMRAQERKKERENLLHMNLRYTTYKLNYNCAEYFAFTRQFTTK